MDFMKVFDQTVREIKREVNLKVLKVPEIEQKVLDATDDEPWGPHGSAMAEIAQATKKFSECQMVMNVLWTRLSETGKNWRFVYKSLAVIEYLVAHGSERAIDDIVEHTYQISSLTSFEYVEPNGKDMGINVRKKAETIVALLNNKDKIQEVRNKAAANRDKYFGLSSTGITYKSSSVTSGSSGGSFQSSDHYGGFSNTKVGDTFKDSYKENDRFEGSAAKARRGVAIENKGNSSKASTRHGSKNQDNSVAGTSRPKASVNDSEKYASVPAQNSSAPSNSYDDDFDDFDPRGTSTSRATAGNFNQVDLFDQSLVGDLMDAPSSAPKEVPSLNNNLPDVDLFADAAFVSAPQTVGVGGGSGTQATVDLFASSQPPSSSATASPFDFFSAPDPVVQPEQNIPKPDPIKTNAVDPFSTVPLNAFDGSDIFGAFTSNKDSVDPQATQFFDSNDSNINGKSSSSQSNTPPKTGAFQVKSGIWADSLSRGLIDLNISAPKKVSLSDIGIVGDLTEGTDEKEKGPANSFYMGRAMGTGSGLGRSSFSSSSGNDDMFNFMK